eukprot:Cvel_16037.t1-p1 / transcript=Cvel_16037.t1 / gene=Cvel_16037 / organism=Chromera_velia_CCMP2878 / gene_product=hypothetical protein / transcript_product=hypothetical protein / location=Cvel_scaffold1217:49168-52897(+) / protein_length=853 / sequence_SO=supercontig / SO=protein_coding / is_pseudo=false
MFYFGDTQDPYEAVEGFPSRLRTNEDVAGLPLNDLAFRGHPHPYPNARLSSLPGWLGAAAQRASPPNDLLGPFPLQMGTRDEGLEDLPGVCPGKHMTQNPNFGAIPPDEVYAHPHPQDPLLALAKRCFSCATFKVRRADWSQWAGREEERSLGPVSRFHCAQQGSLEGGRKCLSGPSPFGLLSKRCSRDRMDWLQFRTVPSTLVVAGNGRVLINWEQMFPPGSPESFLDPSDVWAVLYKEGKGGAALTSLPVAQVPLTCTPGLPSGETRLDLWANAVSRPHTTTTTGGQGKEEGKKAVSPGWYFLALVPRKVLETLDELRQRQTKTKGEKPSSEWAKPDSLFHRAGAFSCPTPTSGRVSLGSGRENLHLGLWGGEGDRCSGGEGERGARLRVGRRHREGKTVVEVPLVSKPHRIRVIGTDPLPLILEATARGDLMVSWDASPLPLGFPLKIVLTDARKSLTAYEYSIPLRESQYGVATLDLSNQRQLPAGPYRVALLSDDAYKQSDVTFQEVDVVLERNANKKQKPSQPSNTGGLLRLSLRDPEPYEIYDGRPPPRCSLPPRLSTLVHPVPVAHEQFQVAPLIRLSTEPRPSRSSALCFGWVLENPEETDSPGWFGPQSVHNVVVLRPDPLSTTQQQQEGEGGNDTVAGSSRVVGVAERERLLAFVSVDADFNKGKHYRGGVEVELDPQALRGVTQNGQGVVEVQFWSSRGDAVDGSRESVTRNCTFGPLGSVFVDAFTDREVPPPGPIGGVEEKREREPVGRCPVGDFGAHVRDGEAQRSSGGMPGSPGSAPFAYDHPTSPGPSDGRGARLSQIGVGTEGQKRQSVAVGAGGSLGEGGVGYEGAGGGMPVRG